MCIKREKKQHMERQVKNNIHHHHIYIYMKINTMYVINKWLQDRVQEDNITKEKEKKST